MFFYDDLVQIQVYFVVLLFSIIIIPLKYSNFEFVVNCNIAFMSIWFDDNDDDNNNN